jgi:hypothetical protein
MAAYGGFSSGAEQLAYADSINGLRLAKDEWMRVNPKLSSVAGG